ncbi:DHA2 family efflux MFS transporter permease subunit [Methylocapsa sp. D3K7]|uniref:DHA2 family efflux MFS transporter permease subunit n=1 Tax=Methylocapsa sp. D3K7 TaxID=3041435 RepID=UPI00244ECA95|nr:DHA2 family efflux MFS transporter permease subunit [Methylocapsa sp. D3K7]WGJ16534.1 DHA2 family efflux MFS transporter permease subunit [Methylocapsa sp. D3K7]
MSTDPSALSSGRKIFAFAVMCVGFFISLLDVQIVSASLQDIGGGLSASPDEVAWVQTSYLIAEIIVIPLSGFLAQVLSTRWLFAGSAAGFTLISLLCGWAWDIKSMIVFRALQGLFGAPMIPAVFTTTFVFFQGQKVVVAAAAIGALASLAPTLGPTIGGLITYQFSWRWLFFINLIPGAFIAIAVPRMVWIDRPDLSLLKRADYLGIALMAAFLGCLQYVLEEGPRWDWFGDKSIRICAMISAVSGLGFIWRSFTSTNPVVDLRALKSRNFSLGCFFSFVTGIGLFSTIYLTPLFLARVRGFDAVHISFAIFSTGLFQLLAVPVYALCTKFVDLRWLLMFGLACFGLGMMFYTPLSHDCGWHELLLPQALRGFAQQFAIAPTVTLTLGGLAPERLKLGSGLFNLMRNLGGAIGIALCGTILNDRANLHFLRLAEHLQTGNAAMTNMRQIADQRYALVLGGGEVSGRAAVPKKLWQLTWREAQVQTFADAFLLIACCFAAASILVPIMRGVAPQMAPPAEAH